MKQQAVRFGKDQGMVGILATPSAEATTLSPLPLHVLLVWNTGISHRIGPHRLNVDLAAALTSLGLAVFRFDLSGRGDSSPRQGEAAAPVVEVQEAMDMLAATYGYRHFIVHGLCSGAVEAHEVAEADVRVVGLSMVDSYAYRCGWYYLYYLRKKLLTPYYWIRLVLVLLGVKKHPRFEQEADLYSKEYPPLASIKAAFRRFAQRRLPCLVIYTNGYDYVYNHKTQFLAMVQGVDVAGILTLEHHSQADHLYSVTAERQRLIDSVSRWVLSTFAPARLLPLDRAATASDGAGGGPSGEHFAGD